MGVVGLDAVVGETRPLRRHLVEAGARRISHVVTGLDTPLGVVPIDDVRSHRAEA